MARGGWSKSLAGFARQVEQDVTGQQKKMAAEFLEAVIKGSPVDEGTFRGNHRASIGQPDMGYDEDAGVSEPPKGGVDADTFQREGAKIAALNVPFTVVYIQNNAPHADAIENGSSKQAPHGVYEIAANNLREKYGS